MITIPLFLCNQLQDTFTTQVLTALKSCLRLSLGFTIDSDRTLDGDMGDTSLATVDEDGFGTMNVSNHGPSSSDVSKTSSFSPARVCQSLIKTAFTCVTRVLSLQASSLEPSRQKEMFDMLADCDGPQFIALGTIVFEAVRLGRLHLGVIVADEVLNSFEYFLQSYPYSKDESMYLLTITFLESTLPLWVKMSTAKDSFGSKIRVLCDFFTTEVEEGRLRSARVRTRLIVFLENYFKTDPHNLVWQLSFNKKKLLPILDVMKKFSRDADVYVRSQTASSLANLFTFASPVITEAFKTYTSFHREFSVNGYEQTITLALFLTNVTIASTTVRRASYFHLLELPSINLDSSLVHIETSLRSATSALGLGSLFNLWEVYAPVILTHSLKIETKEGEAPSLPPSLLGYSSVKQNAEMILRRFGAIYLARSCTGSFSTLCRQSGRRPEDAVVAYLPQMVAGLVCNAIGHGEVDPPFEVIVEAVHKVGPETDLPLLVSSRMDVVLVSVFLRLLDPTTIAEILPTSTDGLLRSEVYACLAQPVPDFYQADSVLYPRSTASDVIRAHEWFIAHQGSDVMPPASIAFNVLHELVSEVGKTPLVIEQIRYIYAIALFVSLYHESFHEAALLIAFLHLSVVLMGQAELAPLVQGFLFWGLDRASQHRGGSSDLADVFVRIAHLAHSFTLNSLDGSLQDIGESLLGKLESVILSVAEKENFRQLIQTVLHLWPRPLSEGLAQLFDEVGSTDVLVSDMASLYCTSKPETYFRVFFSCPGQLDKRLSTAKFTLAKEFRRELESMSETERASFATSTFWHLKSTLSSIGALSFDHRSLRDFTEVLYLLDGQLRAPSIPVITSLPSPNPLLSVSVGLRATQGVYNSAKCCLIVGLVNLLEQNDLAVIDLAYRGLRTAIGLSTDLLATVSWGVEIPSMVKDRINLIGASNNVPIQLNLRNLQDMLQDNNLKTAKNYDTWIKEVTSYLASFLAGRDLFFVDVDTVLSASSEFAERALPLLVQAVLALKEDKTTVASKGLLSRYFESLLRHSSVPDPVKMAIINMVLHLRHLKPSSATSPLAYNHWLDIDCLLLSQAAIQCRAFTTALLFLELRNEHHPGDRSDDINDVLYKIYSNIEDPDGFYGIQSTDIRSSLIRRFHHESQWTKAFSFHGADFQISSNNQDKPLGLQGTLHSLHSFGFDKMAMSLLQGSHAELGGSAGIPDDLGYELAWRTGNWDLPIDTSSAFVTPGASLYAALKAVHRERDPTSVTQIVNSIFHGEILRMSKLSIESMTDLRMVKTSLLCLREIQNWLAKETPESTEVHNLSFAPIRSNFELVFCSLVFKALFFLY